MFASVSPLAAPLWYFDDIKVNRLEGEKQRVFSLDGWMDDVDADNRTNQKC